MGWVTDDGLHEGFLVAMFADGQRAAGVTSGAIADDQVVVGREVEQPDGTWAWPTRPAAEVTGWVLCCDCSTRGRFGAPDVWVGPVFTRVPSKALEALADRRIFAADEDVPFVAERDDVEKVSYELWRSEHTFNVDALGELESAAESLSQAKLRVEAAVVLARHSGASWAAIGRATGMTRQSAQERWRAVDNLQHGGAE